MSRKFFGTDGIRGKVGEFPIVPDFVMRLGYACGCVLLRHNKFTEQKPAVLIGKDTRLSGYMFESALEAGFSAAGVDVFLAGPLPTPAVAYLTRALRLQAGVVISASHNPYGDNGIKFFSAGGKKFPDSFELEIEAEIAAIGNNLQLNANNLGKVKRLEDARGRYIEFCKSTYPNRLDLRGKKIVVDCANGASYHIAPAVFHELGADVIAIGISPDGRNINLQCGATAPAILQKRVVEEQADYGIAIDGDGDRLIMVDRTGALLDGDQLLAIICLGAVQRGEQINGVVGTLMSNQAIENTFRQMNINFIRAKVGDRYVLEALEENSWIYGGENSGHILCLNKHSTGDAIVAALQVLTALADLGEDLATLSSKLQLYPQKLINVKINNNFNWQDHSLIVDSLTMSENRLQGKGRVLLRKSGTEPVLRVMVEGQDINLVNELAEQLAIIIGNQANNY